jgi:hypothetical protein
MPDIQLEGGPAFPGRTNDTYFYGMSLRDYFAAKAMQGMMGSKLPFDMLCECSYQMADAMLEARQKETHGQTTV